MTRVLDTIAVDDELTDGASNAVRVCLRVRPGERATLITDEATADIAGSLYQQMLKVGAHCSVFVLEDFGPRPHASMPDAVMADLAMSQVSIFAAQGQPGELVTRMQMASLITQRKIRHAHMINIDRRIMREGMRANYAEVDEISTRVLERARRARSIRATTARGTDIRAKLSPSLNWIKTSGIISPETWGNLPGGEVFTSPARLDGRFIVDGVVGDYLCAKYGDLARTPMTIDIVNSRITRVESLNQELEREFQGYCHTDENSDRVGEFAIGTNIALDHVIGNILQDEKIPGVHIAFGHPYAEHTGADWISSTHIDVVGTQFDIWIDDQRVMEQGKFVL